MLFRSGAHSQALRQAGHGEAHSTFPDRTSSRNVTRTNNHKTAEQPQQQSAPALPRESNELQSSTRSAGTTALTNANLKQKNILEHPQLQKQNTPASEADNESEAGGKGGDGDWTPAAVLTPTSSNKQRPAELVRRQSLLPTQQAQHLIHALLDGDTTTTEGNSAQPSEGVPSIHTRETDHIRPGSGLSSYIDAGMPPATRKIWVKRPGSSATLVQIREDDLVDDVRDMILRKYANSLGRNFDARSEERRVGKECPV